MPLITMQEFATSPYADIADQVDNIESVIRRAETHIESQLERKLTAETYIEDTESFGKTIFLEQRPVIRVLSVKTTSGESVPVGSLKLKKKSGLLMGDRLAGQEFTVTYVAGYENVPEDIKAAVILYTTLLAFQDYEVFGAGDGKEPAIKHLNKRVDELIQPYVRQNYIVL